MSNWARPILAINFMLGIPNLGGSNWARPIWTTKHYVTGNLRLKCGISKKIFYYSKQWMVMFNLFRVWRAYKVNIFGPTNTLKVASSSMPKLPVLATS